MWSKTSPPEQYSITKKIYFGVSIISYNYIILGWLINFKIWISLATLSTSATSIIRLFYNILMATYSEVKMWIAFLTFPNVPSPIVFSIKYMYLWYLFYNYQFIVIFYNHHHQISIIFNFSLRPLFRIIYDYHLIILTFTV